MATAFNNIYDKYEVFASLFSKAIVIYVLLRSPERQKLVKYDCVWIDRCINVLKCNENEIVKSHTIPD